VGIALVKNISIKESVPRLVEEAKRAPRFEGDNIFFWIASLEFILSFNDAGQTIHKYSLE
jgi:hypothetical protein